MGTFQITGRRPVGGTHRVPGNKNAALPMIAAVAAIVLGADAVVKPVEVRVRQTPQGPRIFVDGRAVRPRHFVRDGLSLKKGHLCPQIFYTSPLLYG